MDGHSIALAFNTANQKKSWTARASVRSGGVDVVHFTSANGMVTLVYEVADNRFAVKFNKLHGAWGDYITAIARSLYGVLNTLKAAGLAFEAPPSPEGIEIVATKGAANTVYVRYVPPAPATVAQATMPELRVVGVSPALGAPYDGTTTPDGGDPYADIIAKLDRGTGNWRDPAEPDPDAK